MSILKLITQNFRNLDGKQIIFHSDNNFIIGENGSGKSSLLEAIFFLGHGKSFRTTKINSIVHHQESKFVVSIKDFEQQQLGLSRDVDTGQTDIKVNSERQSRLSDLAKNIAVQIVTPESFKLFFGGPKERRRFVDLGLFHVKHDFSHQWRDFSRVLKQRNACLRSVSGRSMLDYWTDIFCQHCEIVAQSRSEYVIELTSELKKWTQLLLPSLSEQINVQYLQGWNQKKSLKEVLLESRDREIQQGFSSHGAQKFDVRFLLNRTSIDVLLSRGQQKLFLLALTFAQAKLIERVNRVKPILLIDDIGSELDINSRTLLSQAIDKLNCQVIITAIDRFALEPLVSSKKNYKMFHVKHGGILEISDVDKS
ncbi:MAG: DNA replication/repair protein RecF [Colwellia sp.]|nr:DNA replication/repair protein RecF [Colwellia sp.]